MTASLRAAALAEYHLLDSSTEAEFDDFTRLAAQICGTPVSLISLLDTERQWFKSKFGVDLAETPIEHSFCTYTVAKGALMEVPNMLEDERFKGNLFVAGPPNVRFYAGAPLITPEGVGIGALCVLDLEPRQLTFQQRDALESLARHLMHLLEARRGAHRLRMSEARIRELNQNLERLVISRTNELRDSEERFRQLAEHSQDVFWFVAVNPERMLYVSPAVEKVWGRPRTSFYEDPREWLKAVHPDDLPRVLQQTNGITTSSSVRFETEFRLVQPDGSIRWVQYRGNPIRDAQGNLVRVGGISKDITESKNTADALRLSVERMQLAAKASRVGIWDYNFASENLDWDDEMFKLYGLERESALAGIARWQQSILSDDRASAFSQLEETINDPTKSFNAEFRIVRRSDQKIRDIRAMGTVFRDEKGAPLRIIGTNWDITEDRQREKELATALSQQKEMTRAAQAGERAKSEFLAVMSHEIRTPLNGILGFADILAEMKELPAESRDHVETITTSGQALLRILNDVLDFSRIEAGQLKIEKTTFSLSELVSDIFAFYHSQAQALGLTLRLLIDPAVPKSTNGDAGRIRQILLNLVGNALKFTQKGSIEIELGFRAESPRKGTLEFVVKDTGPGIPPDKIQLIFQAFTQVDSSHTRKFGGTGLGLTISRQLSELMGGTLHVANVKTGGARFTLSVPFADVLPATSLSPAVSPHLAVASPSLEELGKVLVVEDDKVNLKLIVNVLRNLGHEPFTAKDGLEALAIFEAERLSCILMDIQMPGMDGIEATRQIRLLEATNNRAPIFIAALTANVLPEDQKRCFEAGMDLYLNKPIKKQFISDALWAAVSSRHRRSSPIN